MSGRRNRNQIRGPHSALTDFLAVGHTFGPLYFLSLVLIHHRNRQTISLPNKSVTTTSAGVNKPREMLRLRPPTLRNKTTVKMTTLMTMKLQPMLRLNVQGRDDGSSKKL